MDKEMELFLKGEKPAILPIGCYSIFIMEKLETFPKCRKVFDTRGNTLYFGHCTWLST